MSQSHQTTSRSARIVGVIGAMAMAAGMGAAAGALVAWLSPSAEFGWAGLLALPAWLALEIYLSSVAELYGGYSKSMRFWATLAVVAGFYCTWLLFRA